ncbi:MAG: M14 metallopeptidase family protein [Planctomycetota bacterium]
MRFANGGSRAFTIVVVCAGCLFFGSTIQGKQYDGYKIVQVTVNNQDELSRLESIVETIMNCHIGVGTLEVVVSPEQLDALQNAGFATVACVDDVAPLMAKQMVVQRGASFHDAYHTLAEIHTQIQQFAIDYPAIAQLQSFGTSLDDRDLLGLRITGPGDGSQKPGVFFHGGQHAREWIGPASVLYMMDQLLTNYGTDPLITRLVDEREWFILPVMNPDGYEFTWVDTRLWRKNRRNNGDGTFGVDLNRNWAQGWGGEGSDSATNSEIYRGPSPFSEPESAAMRDFVWAHDNIAAYIDFHNYSELLLWPWGNTNALNPDNPEFQFIGSRMAERIADEHGHQYVYGPIYSTIYPASGGSCDWVYGANINDRFIFAIAIELRDEGQAGFLLPPEQIVPTGEENLAAVLYMAHAVSEPLRIELVSSIPPSLASGETLTVTAQVIPHLEQVVTNDVSFYYRDDGGSFTELAMSSLGANLFSVNVPVQDCSGTGKLEFYVEATGNLGGTAGYPTYAPLEFVAVPIGRAQSLLKYDMETTAGWTVGDVGDTASAVGVWVRVDPVGTLAQPENDYSPPPGIRCWVTGQGTVGGAIGASDVDNGKTTLFSPVFSLPDDTWDISYARWYSNDQGSAPNADQMDISISNDGGAVWEVVEFVAENANAWVVHQFKPIDVGVPASAQMKLRFVASDLASGSIVEAGIDEFVVSKTECNLPDGDANEDDLVNLSDVTTIAACMNGPAGTSVSSQCAYFNFDLDRDVDMDDYLEFMTRFGS